jgi:endonuclease/exonuclease/phosphatase family metal-dependent hydrolase
VTGALSSRELGARTAIVRRFGAVAILALVAVACATARNYDDPSGPIVAGRAPAARISARPQGVHARSLRIVTFNVEFARHVDRAAALLSEPGPLHDADILLLQEMDAPGTKQIADRVGMNYAYVPSAVHPSSRRDIGVAVLSAWPILDTRKVPLPHPHRFRKLHRSALEATVESPLGLVRVYSVHFETLLGASGHARRDQARTILDAASAWSGPVIVGGDFNGRGAADEMARAGFVWLTRSVHHTSRIFDLDQILVRGLCPAGHPEAAKVNGPTGISDHHPVWSVVGPCGP